MEVIYVFKYRAKSLQDNERSIEFIKDSKTGNISANVYAHPEYRDKVDFFVENGEVCSKSYPDTEYKDKVLIASLGGNKILVELTSVTEKKKVLEANWRESGIIKLGPAKYHDPIPNKWMNEFDSDTQLSHVDSLKNGKLHLIIQGKISYNHGYGGIRCISLFPL